jgi:hypothetical protein
VTKEKRKRRFNSVREAGGVCWSALKKERSDGKRGSDAIGSFASKGTTYACQRRHLCSFLPDCSRLPLLREGEMISCVCFSRRDKDPVADCCVEASQCVPSS